MAEGTINNGDYTAEDDSSGDYILKDPQGNIVQKWDDTNNQWDYNQQDITNLSSVSAGDLQNSINDKSIQAAWDGLVTPTGPGLSPSDAIDPSTTSTPVQDAISTVSTAGGGTVLLPPEQVVDDGPINGEPRVSIIGFGTDLSEIFIPGTAGTDGYVVGKDVFHSTLDGFTINTGGAPTGRGFVVTSSGSFRNCRIPHLHLRGWEAQAIYWDGEIYQTRFDNLLIDGTDAGDVRALIDVNNIGPVVGFGTIASYPVSDRTSSNSRIIHLGDSNGSVSIDNLTIGGSPAEAIFQSDPSTSTTGIACSVGHINYEPSSQPSSPSTIAHLAGDVPGHIWQLRQNTGTVDYLYSLGSNNGKKILGPYNTEGTLNNTATNIANQPTTESWAFMTSGAITNSAGSATSKVRSLATAGTGNG